MNNEQDEFDFFTIDREQLDTEWMRQAELFFKHASRLADAKRDLESVRAEQEVTYAELDQAIRANPEQYDLKKISEGAIKQAILSQGKYSEINIMVGQLKHKVDILQAAVSALDHRKRALENLVELWSQDYWAEPRIPKIAQDKVKEADRKMVMEKTKIKKKPKDRSED